MAASVRVLTICSLKHKHVWKLTSNLLPKFVQATEFFVYVPDEEFNEFLEVTDKQVLVKRQSTLDVGFYSLLRQAVDEANNLPRFGWYLQQFYKIQALIDSPADLTIIWDADCVPTKSIQLYDEALNPIYMHAAENHRDYFVAIEKLLGLSKVQNQSFVIPGFPMRREWIKEFVKFIEDKHQGKKWYEAIIETTDLSLLSGFSETETLGTWISNRYPKNWKSTQLNWERYGQSRFGYAKNFNPESLTKLAKVKNLDIITFENWDVKSLKKKIGYLFKVVSKAIVRNNPRD